MPSMPPVFQDTAPVGEGGHVVQEGECLHSIAARYGFFWQTVWDHPGNAELRRIRKDPMVILPGDRVTIPPREPGSQDASTEARHRFRRRGVPARLTMYFSRDGEGLADTPCLVLIDGVSQEASTDADGYLKLAIPPGARQGTVRVGDDEHAFTCDLDLGCLDPHVTVKGVQQRLRNLGLYHGPVNGEWNPATAGAIDAFRAAHDLPAEEELSEATLQKIKEGHGS